MTLHDDKDDESKSVKEGSIAGRRSIDDFMKHMRGVRHNLELLATETTNLLCPLRIVGTIGYYDHLFPF